MSKCSSHASTPLTPAFGVTSAFTSVLVVRFSATTQLFCLLIACLLLFGSAHSVRAETAIRVGVYQNKPKEFIDENGAVQGFFPDILEDIAAKEGWRLEWVEGTWTECMQRLGDGDIDLMLDVAYTQERTKLCDFNNETVLYNWSQVYVQKGKRLESVLDLNGKRISVLKGSIQASTIKATLDQFGVKATLVECSENSETLQAIVDGEVDAGIITRLYGAENAQKYGVEPTPILVCPAELRFAVPKEKNGNLLDAIDRRLVEMKEDDKSAYYKATSKWLGLDSSRSEIPRWLWRIIIGGTAVLVLLALLNWLLRNRISAATRELQIEAEQLAREIDERKRTENALRQAHDHIKRFVDADIVGVVIATASGKVIEANDYYLNVIGYTRDEFEQGIVDWRALTPPEWLKDADHSIEELRKGAASDPYEKEYLRRDGTLVSVLVSDALLPGPEEHIAAFILDITERKKAQEEIRASEERFQLSMEATSDGLWDWNAETNEVYYSPACFHMLGYEVGGFPGTLDSWKDMLHPDDVEHAIRANMDCVEGRSETFEVEYRLRTANGQWCWILARGKSIARDKQGRSIRLVGTNSDITERKQAEAELLRYKDHLEEMVAEQTQDLKEAVSLLSATLESTADGILVVNTAGKVTAYNKNFLQLWDAPATLAEAGDDEKLLAFVTDKMADPEAFLTRVKALYATPEAKDFDTIYLKDGRIVERLSLPQRLGETIIGRVWSFRDVTEHKEASEALERAKEEAEAANRAKSIFLANMSHEIRTPMNAVLGYTQILQRDAALSPTQMKYIETLGRSGEFLLSLINDILEMSKIEAGKLTLSPSPTDFHAMLTDVESMFRMRTAEKGLQFDVACFGEVPNYIMADATRVRQVIINMLGNAVKFTQKGGITTRVSSVKGEAGNEVKMIIEVEDTGMGIPENELESIFSSFEQTKRGQAIGGTGLGMAISRQLARLMGGDITVQSKLDEGSTFTFTFSAQTIPANSITSEAGPGSARKILRLAKLPGPRILVVDDKEINRDVLTIMLSQVGYTLKDAANGEECLEAFQSWLPQAILMDQRMPVMDGLTATKLIKATPEGKAIPIIIVTASVLEEDKKEALYQGADGFIRKPYKEAELLVELGKLLNIEYIYDEPQEETPEPLPDEANIAAEVNALSIELAARLVEAAEMGDKVGFAGIVNESVICVSPALGKRLLNLAQDYNYEQIVLALMPVVRGESNEQG